MEESLLDLLYRISVLHEEEPASETQTKVSVLLQGLKTRLEKLQAIEVNMPTPYTVEDVSTAFDDRDALVSLAYESYCAEVGGKAFNGDPLPNWKDFSAHPDKQKQANAWRHCIAIVINAFLVQE